MVSLETPICDFGAKAEPFRLMATDGKYYSLEECMGENGLLVMFICNHCPYVKAIKHRLVRDADELSANHGVNAVAIMSNDPALYEEDSFENMALISEQWGLNFPYLFDETQGIAKSYGAVCTPDFFGFNKHFELQYRGRLDASRKQTAEGEIRRDLFEAMKSIAATGKGPREQIPSMGCSIKWRE